MEKEGILLRTWRVGGDVMDVCAEVVRQEMREMERMDRRDLEERELKEKQKSGGGDGGK